MFELVFVAWYKVSDAFALLADAVFNSRFRKITSLLEL